MLHEFLIVAGLHLLAVVSPGPDLAVVLSEASKKGIGAGIKTSLGVATGIAVHVTYCLLGVALLLKSNTLLFNGVRLTGALYLLWLAWKLVSGSLKVKSGAIRPITKNSGSSFIKGLATNILNPKATLFFLALFTQVVHASTSTKVRVGYGAEMATMTLLWFSLVSVLIGNKKVRAVYEAKSWIAELVFGVVIAILALSVIYEVLR